MIMGNSAAIAAGSRALFADLGQFFGPLIGFGDCLAPQYPSGCLFWIDPTREPKVGDLVWYRWSDAWCAHLRKTLGPDFTFTGGAKWLRYDKGKRYLESNEGRALLTSEWIIIGPVVATLEWRHPPERFAQLIKQQDAVIAAAAARADAAGMPSPVETQSGGRE